MKIVAFLQNQWFKDPPRMKKLLDVQYKGDRERFIKTFLFFGCLTGRRLEAAFGDELCDAIVWEEVSTEMGGESSAVFGADLIHIARVIAKHQPTHVVALGKVAGVALSTYRAQTWDATWELFAGPHPAARDADVMDKLRMLGDRLPAPSPERE